MADTCSTPHRRSPCDRKATSHLLGVTGGIAVGSRAWLPFINVPQLDNLAGRGSGASAWRGSLFMWA